MRDLALDEVTARIREADPEGSRFAAVVRGTFDQLYDGVRTGRYRWDQLHKTEKTHCGTLVEINLQREFRWEGGEVLDYRLGAHEVDCKFSQDDGSWMIPPEAHGSLLLVVTARDELGRWSAGLVRADERHLSSGRNRDGKTTLSLEGRAAIRWLWRKSPLPGNVLLALDPHAVAAMMAISSGQKRVNQLFRLALGQRVSRNVVATVAMQDDYMKRVRENGGARSELRGEGIVVLGDYRVHRALAAALGLPAPGDGEFVSARLARCATGVAIGGHCWRVAAPGDVLREAPVLPRG